MFDKKLNIKFIRILDLKFIQMFDRKWNIKFIKVLDTKRNRLVITRQSHVEERKNFSSFYEHKYYY